MPQSKNPVWFCRAAGNNRWSWHLVPVLEPPMSDNEAKRQECNTNGLSTRAAGRATRRRRPQQARRFNFVIWVNATKRHQAKPKRDCVREEIDNRPQTQQRLALDMQVTKTDWGWLIAYFVLQAKWHSETQGKSQHTWFTWHLLISKHLHNGTRMQHIKKPSRY